MGRIRSGLIIDERWISLILQGEKTWEMRSTKTSKRERIGLIRTGSGLIVGLATITEVRGPFTDREIIDTYDKHKVPLEKIDKWRYAWVLDDVQALDSPIKYVHNNGATIFVTLDSTSSQMAANASRRSAH